MPVGVPAPGATAVTVAVKVTVWPVTAGLTDDAQGDRGRRAVDGHGRRPPRCCRRSRRCPRRTAVSAWLPTPSDTASVAWPAALIGAMPSTVLPSRKVTVPVGVPAGEFTVAVSNYGLPEDGGRGRSAERRRRRGGGLPIAEVHGQPDQIGGQVRGIHHVVAAEGVHRQVVVRPLRAGDVHPGKQAHDGDASSVAEGQRSGWCRLRRCR